MRDDATDREMMAFLVASLKLKARMLKRGQTKVDVKCAKCAGTLHASLNGRKNHIHIHCDGACKRNLVE
jgi:hypothetical protein